MTTWPCHKRSACSTNASDPVTPLSTRRIWALPRWLDRLLPDVTFGHS